jgi:hypothetical protein
MLWLLLATFSTLFLSHDASLRADWLELDGSPTLLSSSPILGISTENVNHDAK